MQNVSDYKEYWKRTLNYDFKQQFVIYKYVCGNMRWKGQIEKVPVDKRFRTYSEWAKYVEQQYMSCELSELREFYRYLNRWRRIENSADGVSNSVLIPFCVAVLAGCLVPQILQIDWKTLINTFVDVVDIFFQATMWQEKIFVIGVIVFCGVLILLFSLLMLSFLIAPIIKICRDIYVLGLIQGYYNDYMEIVENAIEKKEVAEG